MSPGLIWLIAGFLLSAAEMLNPGVFLLWIGIASCCTGLLTLVIPLPIAAQLLSFIIFLAISLAVPLLRRRLKSPESEVVNPVDGGLIGERCVAKGFRGSEGRVFVRDGSWQARAVDGSHPADDSLLFIVGMDGMTLLVSGQKS